ncbi:MAG: FAD-dependent monooxygenase [Nitrospirae bacterium]|nr:FAD-dependent monooxygenase [Nitrospirota bacterium]
MTAPAAPPALPGRADVVVVGAGAAGLTCALVLGRAGLSVCVLEKQHPNTPVPRGEIIQPNGLAALERLGLLDAVRARPHAETRRYHFRRIGGGPLATFDYGELDTPLPTTLVLMPETIHQAQTAALAALPNVAVHEGAACKGLARQGDRGTEVVVAQGGRTRRIRARMVIGADGAQSRVRRAMGVGARVSRYGEGYLTGTLPRPPGFDRDGCYYLGNNEILGLFPVSADTLYFFYLVPLARVTALRGRSPGWLRERMEQIHPGIAGHLDGIRSWRDLHYFPCLKVMAHRWHGPGVALVGHAAHSVNPHVAQGRNMALVDAEELAGRVAGDLRRHGTVRPATLHAYEGARRPQAEALQRLGDELVLFWNAGNPLLCTLRDRAFRGLARNPALRRKVTAEIAGLSREPLSPWERARLVAGW